MFTRKAPITGVLAILLSTAVAAVQTQSSANQPSAAPMTLTALDYVEIEQLVARYARTIDTCSNNGYDYADLYLPDGWFSSSRNGKMGNRFEGRDRLAEAAGGGVRNCEKLKRPEGLWIHVLVNLTIDPTADGAIGKSDLVYPSLRGKDFDADHSGHIGGYEYVFAKTARGWRFRSVIHVM